MTRTLLPTRLTSPWAISIWLWLLGSLPIFLMGIFSLASALGWIEPIPDSETYVANPVPISLHIIGGSLMLLLGPLQVNPRVRLRRRWLHKLAGRMFVLGGVAAGASAIWMALTFPLISGMTTLLSNLFFGGAMLTTLTLGLRSILKGNVAAHRAWILRSYALALGPATQRLLFMPYFLAFGLIDDPILGLILIVGWAINLAVVELWVLRRSRRAPRVAPAE
ncbi:DUF2306 domain-containing protein [Loktanella sp. IMCC34160]|uniref:DUF2306 domain-containing protein n=1 Tax=Loktanella sp. IMCC34160 TaxID=2510646 RepID=UPI00101C58A6|nr:DUF2306 domain-containing protein [Loktanella sp. IMCC34160]RYG92877.1 DUF2306 domain-containing protein [Loktanella sp. IMCC34160]